MLVSDSASSDVVRIPTVRDIDGASCLIDTFSKPFSDRIKFKCNHIHLYGIQTYFTAHIAS